MGMLKINGCPNNYCRSIAPVATLIDLFEKGLPPVAGGSLDQAAWFLEASRTLQSDEISVRYADE